MSSRPTTALGLLCDLINRDNPGLRVPITEQTVGFRSKAVAIALATYGRNTKITIVGKPGQGFKGDLTVMYDRYSLNSLYYGLVPTVKVPAGTLTYRDVIPYVADQLGLFLDVDDFDSAYLANTVVVNASRKSISIRPSTANCYTGQFSVYLEAQPLAYYPDSGPGPKGLLFGDEQAGYFGDCPLSTFVSQAELINTLWPVVGDRPTATTGGALWGKFFWKGKIIYINWSGIAVTNWKKLYLAGAAIGDSTYGPEITGITPTLQNCIFTKRFDGEPKSFRVRTPRLGPDVAGPGDVTTSEIYQLTRKATPTSWYGTGEWSDDISHSTNSAITMHVSTAGSGANYITPLNGKTVSSTALDGSVYWHPVLEYIDPTKEVVPLGGLSGSAVTSVPIVPTDIWATYIERLIVKEDSQVSIPVRAIPAIDIQQNTIQSLSWADDSPQVYYRGVILPTAIEQHPIERLSWSQTMPQVVNPKAIVATNIGIFDPSKRTDLSSLDGELDGF